MDSREDKSKFSALTLTSRNKEHQIMLNIQMGNDEFILYIRKHNQPNGRSTADLGKRIWLWLEAKGAQKVLGGQDQACRWGNLGPFVAADDLPMTATQFEFDRRLLPDLYTFLDTL